MENENIDLTPRSTRDLFLKAFNKLDEIDKDVKVTNTILTNFLNGEAADMRKRITALENYNLAERAKMDFGEKKEKSNQGRIGMIVAIIAVIFTIANFIIQKIT